MVFLLILLENSLWLIKQIRRINSVRSDASDGDDVSRRTSDLITIPCHFTYNLLYIGTYQRHV